MTTEAVYVAQSARTRVRPFTRADVDAWQSWPRHTDPLYFAYNPPVLSSAARDSWYHDLTVRQRQLPFAVEDLNGRLIGRIFLRHVHRTPGSAVLGIDFAPDCLGRGLGTEALGAFLQHYFGAMGFERLYLTVAAHNERARRSYEKLGFRYLGSHWDRHDPAHGDVFNDPRFAGVRRFFRRTGSEVQGLFYDMALDRADFLRRAAEGSGQRPPGGPSGRRTHSPD
jgi:RimJ/RimL family protein N-acetyltransferase